MKIIATKKEVAFQFPDWFENYSEGQKKQYVEDHPDSDISKNYHPKSASPKPAKKPNVGVKRPPKPVEKDEEKNLAPKKEEKKVDKTPAKEVDGPDAQEVIEKEGSPTNFTGPESDSQSLTGNPEKEREIVSDLSKLARMAAAAKEKGEDAPDYDLCKISVPGTNLFCERNIGIPRKEMPQLKGNPVPGSWADKHLEKDKKGEVDSEGAFKEMLKKKGVSLTKKKVDVATLKASQTELVGAKVAGMLEALKQNPNHPGITAPIYVSKDGYILDGHHRWAAMVGLDLADGIDKPVSMNVIEVDMSITDLITETNKFCDEIGIAQKAGKVKESARLRVEAAELAAHRQANADMVVSNALFRTRIAEAGFILK